MLLPIREPALDTDQIADKFFYRGLIMERKSKDV